MTFPGFKCLEIMNQIIECGAQGPYLFLDTPYGEAVRPIVVVRRTHADTAEAQIVPVAAVRRCRPVVAVASNVVERPSVVAAIAGSRPEAYAGPGVTSRCTRTPGCPGGGNSIPWRQPVAPCRNAPSGRTRVINGLAPGVVRVPPVPIQ